MLLLKENSNIEERFGAALLKVCKLHDRLNTYPDICTKESWTLKALLLSMVKNKRAIWFISLLLKPEFIWWLIDDDDAKYLLKCYMLSIMDRKYNLEDKKHLQGILKGSTSSPLVALTSCHQWQ